MLVGRVWWSSMSLYGSCGDRGESFDVGIIF